MNKYFLAFLLSVFLLPQLLFAEPFTIDPQTRKQVRATLKSMTLKQKIGQLTLLDLSNEDPDNIDAKKYKEVTNLIKSGQVGAILNWRGAKATNDLQELAWKHAAGIPILFAQDVVHGFRTVFPTPLAEAAAWNPALAEKTAEIAAIEASAAGIAWTFAPMVDVTADPRWGRIMEGAGEDPYLGSTLASARVRGFQKNNRVAACAKHFVGYGAVTGGREYNSADVSERRLYDLHFPAFQAAVEAGAMTMMSAFNTVNGIPASANAWIMRDILRDQWGFKGFVVSDYNSIGELANHGVAPTGAQAVALALNAGVEMDMEGKQINPDTAAESSIRIYNHYLPELIKNKKVSVKRLNQAVGRILAVKIKLGLFDKKPTDPIVEASILQEGLHPEHRKVALHAAQQSMVLLQNQKPSAQQKPLLPLSDKLHTRVAIIGPFADNQAQMLGAWSGPGRFPGEARPEDVITILQGMRERAKQGKIRIRYALGLPLAHTLPGSQNQKPNSTLWKQAFDRARNADVVIAVLGEHGDASGEASSRTDLDLPGLQKKFLRQLAKVNPNIILLVASGRPLALDWEAQNIPAIVQIWHPGVEAGNAVARILFGDTNPSGKMPVTTVRNVGQIPMHYNALPSGRPRNDLTWAQVPWKRGYVQDINNSPLFPFGYGLSYTQFGYDNLSLRSKHIGMEDTLQAKVTITNKGKVKGTEIVQLYVRDLYSDNALSRPVKELKAFTRVSLAPGEAKEITLDVPVSRLGFHQPNKKTGQFTYTVEPGNFNLWVGPNAAQGLQTSFEVKNQQ